MLSHLFPSKPQMATLLSISCCERTGSDEPWGQGRGKAGISPHAVGGTEGCCLCPEHRPVSGLSTEQRSSPYLWLGLTLSWKAESLFVCSQATAVPWGAEANGTTRTQRDRPAAAPLLPQARGCAPQDARHPLSTDTRGTKPRQLSKHTALGREKEPVIKPQVKQTGKSSPARLRGQARAR